VISVPGPDGATSVRFERRNGERGTAQLVTDGLYRNLWECNLGGRYDWIELLMTYEPLEVVTP